MFNAFQKNTALKHLLLRHNNFEENGAVHFKEALATNESLETLDLSWNKFRTKGTIYIAEGIQVRQAVAGIRLN